MSYYQLLRLIVRGWWRNKLFTVVAWGSLVIGILCVSLLGAFVLHEYHADKAILEGERILRLTQQVSMGEQAETTFIYGPDVPQIVSAFPEIETSTRVAQRSNVSVVCRDETFSIERFMLADSTFLCKAVGRKYRYSRMRLLWKKRRRFGYLVLRIVWANLWL